MPRTWVIGDVHGCIHTLRALLSRLSLSPSDRLRFTGDVIGKGHFDLEVLRLIRSEVESGRARAVLGNNDIRPLLLYTGWYTPNRSDAGLGSESWARFLSSLPVFLLEEDFNGQPYVLVHAGVSPLWSLEDAQREAERLHALLSDYETTPWNTLLGGASTPTKGELNYSLNAFCRIRYCTQEGVLDFLHTEAPRASEISGAFRPWFEFYTLEPRVIFGHWAALEGRSSNPKAIALDTGCVYGGALTAYCPESGERVSQMKDPRD